MTAFSETTLPNGERDKIARARDPETIAMKLFLSLQFDPSDPDWAALVPPLPVGTVSPWIYNLHVRCAELQSLDKEAMAKLVKKRAKATVNEMNLFAAFDDNEVIAADDETNGSGSTVDADKGNTSATAIASGSFRDGQENV